MPSPSLVTPGWRIRKYRQLTACIHVLRWTESSLLPGRAETIFSDFYLYTKYCKPTHFHPYAVLSRDGFAQEIKEKNDQAQSRCSCRTFCESRVANPPDRPPGRTLRKRPLTSPEFHSVIKPFGPLGEDTSRDLLVPVCCPTTRPREFIITRTRWLPLP